ncbi:hypothetical protein PIB30_118154 [Stylosanthes scabra]|uniref:Uncharacterized protein n=1 Tax=Stylosanthes scabra TaxID=79078 RepID=A0ABU6T1Z7_9FABA|nr:hypothetical protein [Stylosanthes scabra]
MHFPNPCQTPATATHSAGSSPPLHPQHHRHIHRPWLHHPCHSPPPHPPAIVALRFLVESAYKALPSSRGPSPRPCSLP